VLGRDASAYQHTDRNSGATDSIGHLDTNALTDNPGDAYANAHTSNSHRLAKSGATGGVTHTGRYAITSHNNSHAWLAAEHAVEHPNSLTNHGHTNALSDEQFVGEY